jgi:hypothetical protein
VGAHLDALPTIANQNGGTRASGRPGYDFEIVGSPNYVRFVYGGTAGAAYDPGYHQACDTIGNLSDRALDEMSDAAAHATLTFALTTSAVNGTDKGKAKGQFDRAFDCQGPHARR